MTKLIVCFLLFCDIYCIAQNYKYINVPNEYETINRHILIDTTSFVDITKYLPNKHVKDGSIDYTSYIQKALNENKYVLMPNFPVLINDIGLDIMSNSIVFFRDNSKVLLKSSSKGSYQILRIRDKKNIKIYNASIVGDRDNHIGNSGEWGMGISIIGSDNIEIYNFNIVNCWGDGIYIGHSQITSSNIQIYNGKIDNNRRNGISIISVNNLIIKDVVVSNSNGTNPNTGIDIEPNYHYNILKKIKIENVVTFNNKINGILIHLAELPSNEENLVQIDIINHKDYYSARPIRISSALSKEINQIIPLTGDINIYNFNSFDNLYEPVINENKFFPKIEIKNSRFRRPLISGVEKKYK